MDATMNLTRRTRRRIAGGLLGLVFASVVSYEMTVGIGALTRFEPAVSVMLVALLVALIVYALGPLEVLLWSAKSRWIRYRSKVGILNGRLTGSSTGTCDVSWTRFTPENWEDRLNVSFSARLIPATGISNGFVAVVNPWGEIFPEEDPLAWKTLDRIFEYVEEGGLFVNVGGLPFFSGWDYDLGRTVPTGRELQLLAGDLEANSIVLAPTTTKRPQLSLAREDIIVGQRLGVSVVTGAPHDAEVYQRPRDQRLAGDLVEVGGSRWVHEFRGIRGSSRRFLPLLRIWNRVTDEEVYPLVIVPYGRGFFVLGGLDLHTEKRLDGTDTARVGFEKTCTAIERLVRNWERLPQASRSPGPV